MLLVNTYTYKVHYIVSNNALIKPCLDTIKNIYKIVYEHDYKFKTGISINDYYAPQKNMNKSIT